MCALVAWAGALSLNATTLNLILPASYPQGGKYPLAGKSTPYGYASSATGPGDASFQWCLDLVRTNMVKPSVTSPAARRRPLVIICGKDGCGTCSSFADMVNKNSRGMPVWFGRLKITTAYFRGKDNGTAPAACAHARAFVKEKFGATVEPCHRIYVYGVYEDGTEYLGNAGSVPMEANAYANVITAQITRFDNDYDKHLFKPPAANAAFAVEDGWLEATPETAQVYVPFTRTNDCARAEVNRLVATFPDNATVVTNDVAWEANVTNLEVAVARPAAGWGTARVRLELLSTNGVSVATNFISSVAATNTLRLPRVGADGAYVEPERPGEWTLQATNGAALPAAVTAANEYVRTNDAPRVTRGTTNFTATATNRVVEVFTDDPADVLDADERARVARWEAIQTNAGSILTSISYTPVVVTNYVDAAGLAEHPEPERRPLAMDVADGWRAVDAEGNALGGGASARTVEVADGLTHVWALTNDTFQTVGAATTNALAAVSSAAKAEMRVYRLPALDAPTPFETAPWTAEAAYAARVVTNYVDAATLAAKQAELGATGDAAVSNGVATVAAPFTNRWTIIDGAWTNVVPQLPPFEASCTVTNAVTVWALTNDTFQTVGAATTVDLPLSAVLSACETNLVCDFTWPDAAAGAAVFARQTNAVAGTTAVFTNLWRGLRADGVTTNAAPVARTFALDAGDAADAAERTVVGRVFAYTCAAKKALPLELEEVPRVVPRTAAFAWTDAAETETKFEGDARRPYLEKSCERTETFSYEETNTCWLVLSGGGAAPATNDAETVVWKTPAYETTNRVYAVTRDQRAGADLKAFQLRVTGGAVWDDRMAELENTFAQPSFAAWCAANGVYCTVVDRRDAATGASLFTHARAANGGRGTRFLSRNGLKEDAARSAVGDDFRIKLIRPNGAVDANGVPQYTGGVQDAAGQTVWTTTDALDAERLMKALEAARALAQDDPTENLNDAAATTPLTLVYGTAAEQTLSAIDTVDVFRLAGAYTNRAVAFSLSTTNGTALATGGTNDFDLAVCDADGAAIAPLSADADGKPVWVFGADATNVYVKVSSTNRTETTAYAVRADAAPTHPGAVGFTAAEAAATEGATNDVLSAAGAPVLTFLYAEGTTNYFGLAVERTGYTGAATATVSLDVEAIPDDGEHSERTRVVWPGDQQVTWSDLEGGVQATNIVIGLVNDGIWHGRTTLAFTLTAAGEGVATATAALALTYLDDEVESIGELALVDVAGAEAAGDGWLYARAGEVLRVTATRRGGSCSNVTGRLTANVADVALSPDAYRWLEKSSATNKLFEVALPSIPQEKAKQGWYDLTLTLAGEGIPVAKDARQATVRVLAADAPGWTDDDGGSASSAAWTGVQYVAFDESVALDDADDTFAGGTLKKISGTLPAGLKAAFKAGALTVSGTPTQPTAADGARLVYWVQKTDGVTVRTMPVTLTITIQALADVNKVFADVKAARTWTGLPLLDAAEGTRRLRGLLDLTVSPRGRMSAKLRTAEGKTVSFSAPGFAGFDAARGDLALAATRTLAGVTNVLDVTLFAAGGVRAAAATNGAAACAGEWPADDAAGDVAAGAYVAAFPPAAADAAAHVFVPSGAATLTFRAAKTARTTFAGVLPNGRTFSGAATRRGGELPLLAASATDAFAALLAVDAAGGVAAADGTEAFWAHRERNFAALSHETALGCVGAPWAVPEDAELAFAAWDVDPDAPDATLAATLAGGRLAVTDVATAADASAEVTAARLALNRASGVVQGALCVKDAATGRRTTRTARGVLVPTAEGPALFGAWWWSEAWDVPRDDGRAVRKTVRRGGFIGNGNNF